MWGSERQGAFANALGASHGGNGGGVARTTCFCPFCEAKAKARGVDPARARAGFQALGEFVQAGKDKEAAGRRVLRDAMAIAAALSGTAGVGDAVDGQPARNLRGDLQQGEIDQAVDRRWMAHLA